MDRKSSPHIHVVPSSRSAAVLLASMTCLALAGCIESLPKTANTATPVTTTAPLPQPTSAPSASPNPPARAQTSALPPWRGEWVGTLDCGRGPVQLKFLLFRQQGPRFGVMGEILSIAGKKPNGVPNFTMIGEETGNQLRMRWERWAHQPLSDRTLNFDGEYVAADNTLALKPLDSACKPLSMRRQTLEEATKQPAPQSSASALAQNKADSRTQAPSISFSTFLTRLGEKGKSTQRFVGTTLNLKLQPGAIDGAEGFVQDPNVLILFRCPPSSSFNGGALTSKIKRLRETDQGIFVDLERC